MKESSIQLYLQVSELSNGLRSLLKRLRKNKESSQKQLASKISGQKDKETQSKAKDNKLVPETSKHCSYIMETYSKGSSLKLNQERTLLKLNPYLKESATKSNQG